MSSISVHESPSNQLQIASLWKTSIGGCHKGVVGKREGATRILWADNYLLCPSQSLPNSMTFKELSCKHGWGSYIVIKIPRRPRTRYYYAYYLQPYTPNTLL